MEPWHCTSIEHYIYKTHKNLLYEDVFGGWASGIRITSWKRWISHPIWLVVQCAHLEKSWSSSMGFGLHPYNMKWKIIQPCSSHHQHPILNKSAFNQHPGGSSDFGSSSPGHTWTLRDPRRAPPLILNCFCSSLRGNCSKRPDFIVKNHGWATKFATR